MYYLFKVERCDAINLLSKHETFEDALAAMKESLVKKIKETKGFSITAGDLTPENADKYSFEFDADPSFPFDDEKGPVITATNYSDDGITEWAIFNVTTGGKFILFKNVEDRYMNVLDTYDTYDDAYEAMKEDVVQEVNDTFDEEIFDTYNVDDEDGEAEDQVLHRGAQRLLDSCYRGERLAGCCHDQRGQRHRWLRPEAFLSEQRGYAGR